MRTPRVEAGTYFDSLLGVLHSLYPGVDDSEWGVRVESRKIATETGVPFETVYNLFRELMSPHIRLRYRLQRAR